VIGRRLRHILGPLVAALMLAACGAREPTAMTLPDPPAPIARPAEYAFGDHVASVEEKLVGQVDRSLRDRFGKPAEAHLTAPAGTDFAATRRWYEGQASGWQALPQVETVARAGGGQGFGFSRDGQAFVLLWLAPDTAKGLSPITILRYGKLG
jgi:hypothetical protein